MAAGLRARECMHIARVLCIIMIVLLHRVKIKRHHFNCTGDEVNDHCNIITFLFSTHAYEKHFRSFVLFMFWCSTNVFCKQCWRNIFFKIFKWEADNTVNQFGNGRLSLLFSLAKMISNSACGLVGYHLSRLNKSDNRPSPYRLTVY